MPTIKNGDSYRSLTSGDRDPIPQRTWGISERGCSRIEDAGSMIAEADW